MGPRSGAELSLCLLSDQQSEVIQHESHMGLRTIMIVNKMISTNLSQQQIHLQ